MTGRVLKKTKKGIPTTINRWSTDRERCRALLPFLVFRMGNIRYNEFVILNYFFMGFFAPTQKVLPTEWEERIKPRLRAAGIPDRIIKDLDEMNEKAMRHTKGGGRPGLDKEELRRFAKDLRKYRGRYNLDAEEVEEIVKAFEREL